MEKSINFSIFGDIKLRWPCKDVKGQYHCHCPHDRPRLSYSGLKPVTQCWYCILSGPDSYVKTNAKVQKKKKKKPKKVQNASFKAKKG